MSYADSPPKLVGGSLCLDLVNTVGFRGRREARSERLVSFEELLHWGAHAGVLGKAELRRLLAEARRAPDEAARVLGIAVDLREAVARLLDPETPRSRRSDLALLNGIISRAPPRSSVVSTPQGGYRWGDERPPSLERPLWHVAWDAADLLTSERRERVRFCGDRECGWMFLDLSRGNTRRWCSMEDCGNRAKARRHYARTRPAAATRARRRG